MNDQIDTFGLCMSDNNDNLAKQITDLDRKVERRFSEMDKTFADFRHEIRGKLQPFHDYITKQQGYELGVKDATLKSQIKSGDIRISKEVWWLIVKIVGFIGVTLTIILGLINGKF